MVVRPESVVLHRKKPAQTENILEGKVGAAMFLGEYVDCTVEIGRNVMQTHQHYTLQVRRGDPVWVEFAGECMALPARHSAENCQDDRRSTMEDENGRRRSSILNFQSSIGVFLTSRVVPVQLAAT